MQDLTVTRPKEARIPDEHIPISALIPSRHEWSVYQAMAENAAKTKFAQQLGGPAGVLSIMLYARELAIPPMLAVMGGFHNVQGHIEMSARLINMRIRQEGHTIKLKKLDYSECILYGKRSDTGEDMDVDYSMEDARRAGLVKKDSNWDKHPKDMLWARAITRLGRRLFPDVIGNAYVEGEVGEVFNVTPDVALPIPASESTQDEKVSVPDENKLIRAEFWRKIKGNLEINEEDWPETEAKINEFLDICARHNEASIDEVIIEAIKDQENFTAFWSNLCSHMGKEANVDSELSSQASEEKTENETSPSDDFRSEWINLKSAGYSDYVWKNLKEINKHPEFHDEMRDKWKKLYTENRFPLDPEQIKTEGDLQTQAHLDAIHGSNNGAPINCPKKGNKIYTAVCERDCQDRDKCQPYQEHVFETAG